MWTKDQMENDSLDAMLAKLPGDPPPHELGLRICQAIRERHQRHLLRRLRLLEQARMVLSSVLALAGAWLVIPLLNEAVQRLALPPSGIPMLVDGYEMARTNVALWLSSALESLVSFQGSFTSGFEATAWVGVLILASSALLALSQMLPYKKENR